jgi:hypothetical protein
MLLQWIRFTFANPYQGGAQNQNLNLDGFKTFTFNSGSPAQDTFTRSN